MKRFVLIDIAVVALLGISIGLAFFRWVHHQRSVAYKGSEAQVQRMSKKPQAPKRATPEPRAAGAPASPSVEGARVRTVSAVQSQFTTADVGSTATGTETGGKSSADAAKRMKQHKACLELAKDYPSIICN